MFFTEVAGPLDPAMWTVIASEDRPRTTMDPTGATITIHDAVLRAQRNAEPTAAGPGPEAERDATA